MKIVTPWLLALILAGSTSLPLLGTAQEATPGQSNESVGAAESMDAETAEANEESARTNATAQAGRFRLKLNRAGRSAGGEPTVVIGSSYVLKAGETAQEVVVIGGSATIHGKVTGDVVVVGGSIAMDGEIAGDAVAVGGSITTSGEIGGDAVVVLGGLTAAKGANIKGDAVAVGGGVEVANGATVGGTRKGISLPAWLRLWFTQCVLKLRPLAPQVAWLWAFVGVSLLIYLLIAAVFPRPVQACVEELTRRPATTFLMGLLTKLLLPLVLLILTATGLGVFVIPFVLAALFLGVIVGKVAIFEALGFAVGKTAHIPALQRPIPALLAGFIIVILLYMVPILGLLTLMLTSLWGLGTGVMAAFSGFRRETDRSPAPPAMGVPAMPMTPIGVAAMATAGPGSGSTPGDAATFMAPPIEVTPGLAVSPQPPPHVQPESTAFPRSGFWERMGAGFLDVVLVSIVGYWVSGPPFSFLIALAYFAGMWAWKGTTVGGIILGLKVVRLDGRPVTFAVALVRALGAAFSIIILFLGFLWIAWDGEKQGWHDRIAGTVVVKLPRGTSLVCF
jgi:uncharacterized RDD family membrane protein YckC